MVYLVETFRPYGSTQAPGRRWAPTTASSRSVQLLGRLAVPSDEIEFWLFEAPSRDELTTALATAGMSESRISKVEDLTLLPARRGRKTRVQRATPRLRSKRAMGG
ncbi:MAG TPA: hypothetical protein VHR16_09130 [Candidatus Limnocylindrales bacterium]|nr:hypothetical protein [Candidatus Limnocylindrales bacterium]